MQIERLPARKSCGAPIKDIGFMKSIQRMGSGFTRTGIMKCMNPVGVKG